MFIFATVRNIPIDTYNADFDDCFTDFMAQNVGKTLRFAVTKNHISKLAYEDHYGYFYSPEWVDVDVFSSMLGSMQQDINISVP